ncbi:hypothetical protein COB52_00975 [Candidatus Kaiserbacteria bacterium]|nr:MAG: hypothetical protein COB52_00975 [Candidatus Kaiserbacteria bacterium]
MHRILKFVEGEVRGLHETAYLLGFFTLLSTLLGLVRDRLLASSFGAGDLLDIYYAAFRIPDVIFVSVASLVSVFILVPLLTQKEDEESKHKLLGNVLTGFSIVMLVFSAALWIFMPLILGALFPSLIESNNTLLTLSRLLLLQPILLGASGILASVTQVNGRYILYALAPLLYNLGIILGIVFLYPFFGLQGIVYGVLIGAFMHMIIQVPFIVRSGYLKPMSFKLDIKQLWKVASISVPRTLSITANQIALLVLIVIAGALGSGAISVFSFAFNLQAAPLAIIGASYSVAAFPTLSRFFAKGETRHFCEQIVTASRHIIFWAVPLTVLVIVLRAHIVRVVLGSGEFNWADTRLTAAALALFVVSLIAQSLSLLFLRGYYAAGETRKPLLINVSTAIGIVVGSYALLRLFAENEMWRFFVESILRVEGIPGTEILMLPLSYAIFSVINVLLFIALFERDFGTLTSRLRKPFFESFSAAVVAGFFAHQTLSILARFLDINTFVGVFSIGMIAALVGVTAGVSVLHVLNNKEIKEVSIAMHHKIWRYFPTFKNGKN